MIGGNAGPSNEANNKNKDNLNKHLQQSNPLECQICNLEIIRPVRLICQHYFCYNCILNQTKCPLCLRSIDGEVLEDRVLRYVLESSREVTEYCANCDKIQQPMYFCETCQQPLCCDCKINTHQAKIFSTHHIRLLEERGRIRGNIVCPVHNEPFILFCLEAKKLMCIECFNSSSLERKGNFVNIDIAHKICCDKLEKSVVKMHIFQDELNEQILLRKNVVEELEQTFQSEKTELVEKSEIIITKINLLKNNLLEKLNEEKNKRQNQIEEELKFLKSLENPVRINLLSSSIFCSYASKADLLHCFSDLSKAIQQILLNKVEKLNVKRDLPVNFDNELIECLHLKDVIKNSLKQSSNHADFSNPSNGNENYIQINPLKRYSMTGKLGILNEKFSINNFSLNNNNISTPNENSFNEINHNTHLLTTHELNNSFMDCLRKIDFPIKKFVSEISLISKTLLNIQRDITHRRCVVNREDFQNTLDKCEELRQKLESHFELMQKMQEYLQELWQEQIDRVQRQQNILHEKFEEMFYLQSFAEKALNSAEQIRPFAFYMATVISTLDCKRITKPSISPMEQICMQISSLEPDSKQRCEAIEKEEESRRQTKIQEKLSEQKEAQIAKMQLKEIKFNGVKMRNKREKSSQMLTVVNRDRSSMIEATKKRNKKREHRISEGSYSIYDTPFTSCQQLNISQEHSAETPTPSESRNPLPLIQLLPPPLPIILPNQISLLENVKPQEEEEEVRKLNVNLSESSTTGPKLNPKPKFMNFMETPSTETVKARDRLLESIKERVKLIE